MTGFFKLNWRDLVKGLVVAVLSSLMTLGIQALQAGGEFDFKVVAQVALSSGLGYLLKNLATDEDNKLGGHI